MGLGFAIVGMGLLNQCLRLGFEWVVGLGFGGQWLLGVWVGLDVDVVGFGCCFGGYLSGLDWWMFGAVGLWVLVWIGVWPDRWGWLVGSILVIGWWWWCLSFGGRWLLVAIVVIVDDDDNDREELILF